MNNRCRQRRRLCLPDVKPHYNHIERRWKTRVNGKIVAGELMAVAAAYAGVPPVDNNESYYPYTLTGKPVRDDWQDHGHLITDILRVVLANPKQFTIIGNEDKYTAAERLLINNLQRRLISTV